MNSKVLGGIGAATVGLLALLAANSLNQEFDLLMVDGARMNHVVLSSDNYTRLQNNVAVMAVLHSNKTGDPVNMNYCPLAKFIIDHQDGYRDKINGLEEYVFPSWCKNEVTPRQSLNETIGITSDIPEFGTVSAIILCISIIAIIIVTAYSEHKFLWRY